MHAANRQVTTSVLTTATSTMLALLANLSSTSGDDVSQNYQAPTTTEVYNCNFESHAHPSVAGHVPDAISC